MSQNFQEITSPHTAASTGKIAFRIVLGIVFVCLFATPSVVLLNGMAFPDDSKQNDTATLERLRKLENRITALEERERALKREIQLITGRNGVLDKLIYHVKELRAQDQFIVRQMEYAPNVQDGGIEPAQGTGAIGAQHTVVTPGPKISAEEDPTQDE